MMSFSYQRKFTDKYYQEFEDREENKLTYTPIFNKYTSLLEKYIEEELWELTQNVTEP